MALVGGVPAATGLKFELEPVPGTVLAHGQGNTQQVLRREGQRQVGLKARLIGFAEVIREHQRPRRLWGEFDLVQFQERGAEGPCRTREQADILAELVLALRRVDDGRHAKGHAAEHGAPHLLNALGGDPAGSERDGGLRVIGPQCRGDARRDDLPQGACHNAPKVFRAESRNAFGSKQPEALFRQGGRDTGPELRPILGGDGFGRGGRFEEFGTQERGDKRGFRQRRYPLRRIGGHFLGILETGHDKPDEWEHEHEGADNQHAVLRGGAGALERQEQAGSRAEEK